jgi:hypothetical protein
MTTNTSNIAILGRFESVDPPDRILAAALFGAMSLSLATMAILAAPTKKSAEVFAQRSEVIVPLVPALQFASHCRQLLRKALLSFVLTTYLLASALLHISYIMSVHICQAAQTVLCHSIEFSTRVTQAIWNSAQVKRLRKKLEFEFFTLILGGGNSLCLVIFWPGWCILALVGVVLSAWCTS